MNAAELDNPIGHLDDNRKKADVGFSIIEFVSNILITQDFFDFETEAGGDVMVTGG